MRGAKSRGSIGVKQTFFPATKVVTNQVPESILEDTPYGVSAAIGFNCNFNFLAPGVKVWNQALSKLPYYVHVAPFLSEMAAYADIILPSGTFLEEWAYDNCFAGPGVAEARLKQPVVDPLCNSISTGDLIFELARRQGGTVADSFAKIGKTARDFVRFRTEPLLPWSNFCAQGVWMGSAYEYHKYDRIFKTPSKRFEFCSGNLQKIMHDKAKGKELTNRQSYLPYQKDLRFLGDPAKYPFSLLTYQPLMQMVATQSAPWAQEIFLVMHGSGWINFLEINSEAAKRMKVKEGDLVWVESPFDKIKAKARVGEWVHPQVVCIARGQGHSGGGRWAKGIGVNPQDLVGVDYDHLSGQSAFYNTRVKVYKA